MPLLLIFPLSIVMLSLIDSIRTLLFLFSLKIFFKLFSFSSFLSLLFFIVEFWTLFKFSIWFDFWIRLLLIILFVILFLELSFSNENLSLPFIWLLSINECLFIYNNNASFLLLFSILFSLKRFWISLLLFLILFLIIKSNI